MVYQLTGLGLMIMLLLVSCRPETEPAVQNQPIARSTNTATTQAAQLSITRAAVTLEPSSKPTPSATIAVETPSPSPTSLPTETATPTPWPTLPPDEAVNQVLTLLQDNQNPDCLLPCWWGAVPGQTYWPDIRPYLSSYALTIDDSAETVAFALFSVPESVNYAETLNLAYRYDTSKIVTGIRVSSVNIAGYDPRTMMSLYGIPDEVWLWTYDEVDLRENILPFYLIIVYQEKGVSFFYYVDASISDGIVTRCFEPGVVETERPDLFPAGPQIYLWEPGQHKRINEITNVSERMFLPLEETADLTPQTFYEKFTDLNQSPCIDTPANLWWDW
jgi:hypothetical protein